MATPPQLLGGSELSGVPIFYVAPTDRDTNVFAAMMAGFNGTRIPLALEMMRRRLDAMDPSARIAELVRLEEERGRRIREHEATVRQAQKLAADEARDFNENFRVVTQAKAQLASARTKADSDVAVAGINQDTELRRQARRTDESRALTSAASDAIIAAQEALVRADALPPEQKKLAQDRARGVIERTMEELNRQANDTLNPEIADRISDDLIGVISSGPSEEINRLIGEVVTAKLPAGNPTNIRQFGVRDVDADALIEGSRRIAEDIVAGGGPPTERVTSRSSSFSRTLPSAPPAGTSALAPTSRRPPVGDGTPPAPARQPAQGTRVGQGAQAPRSPAAAAAPAPSGRDTALDLLARAIADQPAGGGLGGLFDPLPGARGEESIDELVARRPRLAARLTRQAAARDEPEPTEAPRGRLSLQSRQPDVLNAQPTQRLAGPPAAPGARAPRGPRPGPGRREGSRTDPVQRVMDQFSRVLTRPLDTDERRAEDLDEAELDAEVEELTAEAGRDIEDDKRAKDIDEMETAAAEEEIGRRIGSDQALEEADSDELSDFEIGTDQSLEEASAEELEDETDEERRRRLQREQRGKGFLRPPPSGG